MHASIAAHAFHVSSDYDTSIFGFMNEGRLNTFKQSFAHGKVLRYGENPHQEAAYYSFSQRNPLNDFKQLHGKELSYNNIGDTDAALECVKQFDEAPACVIVKHANPCGVAEGDSLIAAYDHAYSTDPTSAFGGIIAFNQMLDAHTAKAIIDRQFVEVIIAPEIDDEAREVLSAKKNVRVLACGQWSNNTQAGLDFKRVNGGLLVQDRDRGMITQDDLKVVTQRKPDEREMEDLLFTWKVAKFVKSNAIVYARDKQTIGVGAGQMSRVYSAKIAGIKAADENLVGCESFAETPKAEHWQYEISPEVQQAWALMRKSPMAKSISLALPRFLLRSPYGSKATPVKAFAFEEMSDRPEHEDYLWGNPAFLKAEQIARAFIESGWQMYMASVLDTEDMPVHYFEEGGQTLVKPCAEIPLADSGASRIWTPI